MAVSTAPTSGYLLTTVFTPPADYFTDIVWYSPYGYGILPSYSVGFGPLSGPGCSPCWMGLPHTSSCFPTGWNVSSIYSPGECPMGYTVGCSALNSTGTVTETIATCCPSNYACAPTPYPWPWMSTELCSSSFGPGDFSIEATSIGAPSATASSSSVTVATKLPATRLSGFAVYAYSAQVRFQSTDKFGSSTSIPPTPSKTTLVPVNPLAPFPPGAKARIGIAVSLLTLGILVGALFCLRRLQHRNLNHETADSNTQGLFSKPELEAGTQLPEPKKDEKSFDVVRVSELDTSPPRVPELGPSNPVPEHSADLSQQLVVGEPKVVVAKASDQVMDASVVRKPLINEPARFPDMEKGLISSPEIHSRSQGLSSRAEQKAPEVPEAKERTEAGNENADSLQAEIEKIRDEKEKLSRLLELGRREEKLRQQMAEQKTLKGS